MSWEQGALAVHRLNTSCSLQALMAGHDRFPVPGDEIILLVVVPKPLHLSHAWKHPWWCPFTCLFSKEQPVFKCKSFCASNSSQDRVTFQTNNPFLLRSAISRGSSELCWAVTVLGLCLGLSATHTHGINENQTLDTNLSHEWELISIFTQFVLMFSWQLLQLHAQQGWIAGKRRVLREQRQVIQKSSIHEKPGRILDALSLNLAI